MDSLNSYAVSERSTNRIAAAIKQAICPRLHKIYGQTLNGPNTATCRALALPVVRDLVKRLANSHITDSYCAAYGGGCPAPFTQKKETLWICEYCKISANVFMKSLRKDNRTEALLTKAVKACETIKSSSGKSQCAEYTLDGLSTWQTPQTPVEMCRTLGMCGTSTPGILNEFKELETRFVTYEPMTTKGCRGCKQEIEHLLDYLRDKDTVTAINIYAKIHVCPVIASLTSNGQDGRLEECRDAVTVLGRQYIKAVISYLEEKTACKDAGFCLK